MISVIGRYFTVETEPRHTAFKTSGNTGSCEYLIRTMELKLNPIAVKYV